METVTKMSTFQLTSPLFRSVTSTRATPLFVKFKGELPAGISVIGMVSHHELRV